MKKTIKSFKKKIKSILKLDVKEKRHELVGSSSNWKVKQRFQIDFLRKNGLNPGDLFLDIGCGTLRGGMPIIKFLNNAKYHGIDIRENVILEAKNEIKEERLIKKEPTVLSFSDFDTLKFDKNFDKILAFSVLIHLEDAILDKCLKFVSQHLSDDGVFFANVNYGNNSDGKWLEFPVLFRSFDFYTEKAKKYSMTVEEVGQLKDFGHITEDKLSDEQMILAFKLR
ncbi:class I SAM-dependent methyltransferase [Olleya sp. R77988]|uniref:class I SAM-dependent methyltransferase n=1 Tax=Olleya sp. R77988 TaxID=3093875 RepID=UPI0037CBA60D